MASAPHIADASAKTPPILQGKLGCAINTVLPGFTPKARRTLAVSNMMYCHSSESWQTSLGTPELPPEIKYRFIRLQHMQIICVLARVWLMRGEVYYWL